MKYKKRKEVCHGKFGDIPPIHWVCKYEYMSNIGQKPELGIPNPCAVKDNEFMSPAVSAEGTNLWR